MHKHAFAGRNTQADLVHRIISINYKDQSDPGWITLHVGSSKVTQHRGGWGFALPGHERDCYTGKGVHNLEKLCFIIYG